MTWRSALLILLLATTGILLVVTVGAASPASAEGAPTAPIESADESLGLIAGEQASDPPIQECAAESPPDFADPAGGTAETIGWVEGYWYDEPIDVNVTGGLTEAEFDRLAARTAARFEALRCLPAIEGVPPVTIMSREELEAMGTDQGASEGTVSEPHRFENAKFETLLMIDGETAAESVQTEQETEITAGWYDFVSEEITLVAEDPETLLVDESLLAHELGHAIQDQHFDLGRYDRGTVDRNNGKLGLIEGDVHLIEQRYLRACAEDAWTEDCVMQGDADSPDEGEVGPDEGIDDDEDIDPQGPEANDESLEDSIPDWGLFLNTIQPYSDGPAFIETIYEQRGGWDGVNDLYDDPPTSAIEVADPETYGTDRPAAVQYTDTTTEEWERLSPRYSPGDTAPSREYDAIGISGITAMFAQPALETGGLEAILGLNDFQNIQPDGTLNPQNPFEYAVDETVGWRGDEFRAYENDDGEIGTVWMLVWGNESAAERFIDAYEQLLEYRGGEPIEELEQTYRLDPDTGYDMAVTLDRAGSNVTVVTAPTVETLGDLHEGSLDSAGDGDADGDGQDGGSDGDGEKVDGEDAEGPTYGIVVLAIGIVGALIIISLVLVELRRIQ